MAIPPFVILRRLLRRLRFRVCRARARAMSSDLWRLGLVGLVLSLIVWVITTAYLSLVDPVQPVVSGLMVTHSQLVWAVRFIVFSLFSVYVLFRRAMFSPALLAYQIAKADGTVPSALAYLRAFGASAEFRSVVLWTTNYMFVVIALNSSLVTAVVGELFFLHLPLLAFGWYQDRLGVTGVFDLAMRHTVSQLNAKKVAAVATVVGTAVLFAADQAVIHVYHQGDHQVAQVETQLEQFRAETDRIVAEVDHMKIQLEQFRAETDRIVAENRSRELRLCEKSSGSRAW